MEASHAVLHMLQNVFKSLCIFWFSVYVCRFLCSLTTQPTMSLSYAFSFLDTVLKKIILWLQILLLQTIATDDENNFELAVNLFLIW